jgi:phosphonate transport system ATP-binding protein
MQVSLSAASVRHGSATTLAPLTLEIAAGEQIAVIGPSGAGKTTLLHLLACAQPLASGELKLDGRSPWSLPRRELQKLRGELFLAPQVAPLPPRQRVVTAVSAGQLPRMGLARSLRNLFYPVAIAQADAALARFDLSDKLFARVDRLSGGERQRVGLARALLSQARLLLVDEPLSALDPSRAQQAMDTLMGAARESGATLVTSLHDVPMALRCFSRIIGLRDGQLMFDRPAAAVDAELLQRLYERKLDELQPSPGGRAVDEPAPRESAPATMHCR